MGNAWFNYLGPLGVGVLFLVVGVALIRFYARDARNSRDAGRAAAAAAAQGRNDTWVAGCFGILFGLIGLTVGLAIFFASPTPWQRQQIFDHVFRTPPDRIVRFIIRPAKFKPLARSDVVIDAPARIRQIAETLRGATEISANHPRTKWTADIETVTLDGTYHFGVDATVAGDANGTLVEIWSSPSGASWHLGYARADGLDRILEDAVNAAGARAP